jgi:hypothetical protein
VQLSLANMLTFSNLGTVRAARDRPPLVTPKAAPQSFKQAVIVYMKECHARCRHEAATVYGWRMHK